MRKKNRTPVVITRKDKRHHKLGHLFLFAATGGMSAPLQVAQAARTASYNARTRQLQRDADSE
jgi:hypothetical protein